MTKTRTTYPVLTDPRAWESGTDYYLTVMGTVKTPVGNYTITSKGATTDLLFNEKPLVGVVGSASDDILEFIRKQAHRDQLERLGEKVDPTDDEGFTVARWKVE